MFSEIIDLDRSPYKMPIQFRVTTFPIFCHVLSFLGDFPGNSSKFFFGEIRLVISHMISLSENQAI